MSTEQRSEYRAALGYLIALGFVLAMSLVNGVLSAVLAFVIAVAMVAWGQGVSRRDARRRAARIVAEEVSR